jgi:hypothetical protein
MIVDDAKWLMIIGQFSPINGGVARKIGYGDRNHGKICVVLAAAFMPPVDAWRD